MEKLTKPQAVAAFKSGKTVLVRLKNGSMATPTREWKIGVDGYYGDISHFQNLDGRMYSFAVNDAAADEPTPEAPEASPEAAPLEAIDLAIFDALTTDINYPNDGLADGYYLDSNGCVRAEARPNRATRRAEAAKARRANPPKMDRNVAMTKAFPLADDFDTPNRRDGYCPDCGQPTFQPQQGRHECSLCNWTGQRPNYNKPVHSRRPMPHQAAPAELLGCRVAQNRI